MKLRIVKRLLQNCRVAFKRRLRLEDRAVEQDDGFGGWVRGVTEVVDVTVGAQAADDG